MSAAKEQLQQLHSTKVPGSELKQLGFGCILSVQAQGACPMRFNGELIGLCQGQYLAIRILDNKISQQIRRTLTDKDSLVIRGLMEGSNGACFAFRSYMLWNLSVPVNLLFIAFPKVLEKCELRKFPRVSTCISASISQTVPVDTKAKNIELNGVISDVSLGGFCFNFERPEKAIAVNKKKVIVKVLPTADSSPVLLNGKIRNQRDNRRSFKVGVEFAQNTSTNEALLKKLLIHPGQLRANC